MTLPSGTKLGPYEFAGLLGAGGMGEVYRARDTRLNRDVAVKVLPESYSSDPPRLRRFEQEARTLAALNHPNILAIYDIGTFPPQTTAGSLVLAVQERPYIVSELLEGGTLRERLKGGALPVRKAVEYAQQVARGLAAAHDNGIVHRDLKPENIFITEDGRVKILDFGLAKLTRPEVAVEDGHGAGQALTQAVVDSEPGMILGTVGYMSPEQVRGKAADARSDLFSFGAILYEMLSGKRAFQGESAAETMSAIVKDDPPELTEANNAVTAPLERIVRHCLEKNPAERFHSAHDVAFDLETLSSPSSTRVQPVPASFRVRRLAPVFWMLALICTAALAFFFGKRGATAPLPRFRELTYERGAITNARFAPDGRSVIYDASWDGKPVRIFSTPSDTAQPRSLEFEQAHLLALSSTGEIAVSLGGKLGNHLDVREATLGRAPLAGGAPREILDNVAEADWAPDGTLAVVHTVNGRDRIEYPAGRVLYETNGWIAGLRFSPQGDRLAFLDHPLWPDDRGHIAIVDTAGHQRTLSEEFASADGVAWSPSGEVWFTGAIEGGARSLHAVDLAGRLRTILSIPGTLRLYDIARDGRVLLGVDSEKVGVKAYVEGQKAERDLSWAGWTIANDISPDNKWLLLNEQSSIGGANYTVGMRRLDGSTLVRLGEGNPGFFSKDGKWASTVPLTGVSRAILLPIGVGVAQEIPVALEKLSAALMLPDERHIMLYGAEHGHAFRCFVQDMKTGKLQPVTPEATGNSVNGCVPSPDGTSVVAAGADGKLQIFSTADGSPRVIPGDTTGLLPIRWCADGIYAYRADQLPAKITHIDPATGRQNITRQLAPGDDAGLIAISPVILSPDATAYAYSYRRTLSELYVVDGLK